VSKLQKLSILLLIIIIANFLIIGNIKKKNEITTPRSFTKIEEQGVIIKEFPELPKYPESQVVNTYKKEEDGKVGYEGNWTTSEPVDVVMKWYLTELTKQGWSITTPPENPESDATQFAVLEKEELLLNLIVENEDGEITEIHAEFPLR